MDARPETLRPEPLLEALRALIRESVLAELAEQRASPALPRLFSIAEAAASLGISRAKFYRLLTEGAIHTIHIGGRRLVPEAALRAFIAGKAHPEAA